MAAVTICSDFGTQKNKVWHSFHCLPIFPMKWWDRMPWSYIQIQFNVYNFCNQTLSQNILRGVLHIIKYSSNTILMVLRKSIIWVTIFNLSPWSEVKVSQSCPSLCDSMDYMVHRILQARILEWVASSFSRVSSYRDWTQASLIAGGFQLSFYVDIINHRCLCTHLLASSKSLDTKCMDQIG